MTEPRAKQAVPSDKSNSESFLAFPTTWRLAAASPARPLFKLKPVRNLDLPNPSARKIKKLRTAAHKNPRCATRRHQQNLPGPKKNE
jgi:hypothetical protein